MGRNLFSLLFLIFLFPTLVSAETLVSKQNGKLKFTLALVNSAYELSIQATGQKLEPEAVNILTLDNPARLVVDISGEWNSKSQEATVNRGPIKSLRVGVHPGNVRLVIDLNQPHAPQSQLEDHEGVLVIHFDAGIRIDLPQEETPKTKTPDKVKIETPPPAPAPVETPEKPAPAEPATEPANELSKDIPAHEIRPLTTPAGAGPLLSNILFEHEPRNKAPAISIEIQNLGQYTLTKRKDNLYQLSIQGAKLADPGLSLPRFPPTDYTGLEVVVAEQRGDTVVVSMYVENNTFLTPFREGNKLWVRVGK